MLTALKVFQARNGLNPSGELDSATVKKLNHYRK
ncbi:MAG: peptidoglycan-binding protein [Muribaculaceae bacterium]|nr:peptidoglycan-binding protein [Muribaculaceae bacterium]